MCVVCVCRFWQDRRTAIELLTDKGWQIDARIGPDLVVAVAAGTLPDAWPTEAGSESLQVWR